MKDVAIVGGGILGLSIAYELSRYNSKFKISLFEKESEIGLHQSGNNSGVLHCGLYYEPGSLKAKLAVDGIRSMIDFCRNNEINHDVCGKIVVASDEREVTLLQNLAERGKKNGLKGLNYLNRDELKKREPYVKAQKALLVPEEGIVDYKEVMKKLAKLFIQAGGTIYLGNTVQSSSRTVKDKIFLKTNMHEYSYDLVINCAGLFSDRNYKNLTQKESPLKIIPFRGEYMHVVDEYKDIVNNLIYPVPDPMYPFLGVHFTRMTSGAREVGPNAVLALKREGYKLTDFSFFDTIDSLTYKGFLNFMVKNFSFAMGEFSSSLSKKSFVLKAKKLIPDAEEYMFKKGGTAGVRAQAMSPDGRLIMDFKIIREGNQVHILNAPSPGATASLSIARYIIENFIK
jgi:L-2-hydroxyglutarate oxidase